MKKILSMILVLSLLLGCSMAFAEDLGVQVIGGPNATQETVSLDNLKTGMSYRIEGYAIFKPIDFYYVDFFGQYNSGANGDKTTGGSSKQNVVYINSDKYYYLKNARWKDSGTSADFAIFSADIVNLQKGEAAFLKDASVKVIFDDEYEFAGWVRQTNYDYYTQVYAYYGDYHVGHDGSHGGENVHFENALMLSPSEEETVPMMYTGHYFFGCTLPNEVINSNAPLRMEINLGGNELTYVIRK